MQDRLDTPQSEGEAFRRVWQRVQGQPGPGDYLIPEGPGERPLPPAPPKPQPPQTPSGPPRPPAGPDMEGLLRRIMEELSETACLCRRWQRLWGIARRCDGQIRRLSAALFLLTGRRWRPGTLRCQAGGFPERLVYFMVHFAGQIEASGLKLCQEWVRNNVMAYYPLGVIKEPKEEEQA